MFYRLEIHQHFTSISDKLVRENYAITVTRNQKGSPKHFGRIKMLESYSLVRCKSHFVSTAK